MTGPFVVGVADLLHRRGARRHEHLESPLDGLSITASGVPSGAAVVVDVTFESLPEGIVATGTASAPWAGDCRRCLESLGGELSTEFRELFERHATEGETYPLVHEQVDLEPLVRESLLLELPLAPLCAEACRGICPTCGANLNEGTCACPPADRDPRWAALDVLREDERAPASPRRAWRPGPVWPERKE